MTAFHYRTGQRVQGPHLFANEIDPGVWQIWAESRVRAGDADDTHEGPHSNQRFGSKTEADAEIARLNIMEKRS